MKNVFIAGGAGFIGSHFVETLLNDPSIEMVKIYDNLSTSKNIDSIKNAMLDKRVFLFKEDLKNIDRLKIIMAGSDTVINLAANPDISKAVTDPTIDFREGTVLLQNTLEAMRVNNIKNLVYASGSGVYGEWSDRILFEDHGPMLPISTYGASKLACEALICSYSHLFGIRAIVGRFANVVGPRQTHGVGYDFVRRLKKDPSWLRILGDGTQSKSYVYIDDVISALLIADNSPRSSFEVYNIATQDYIDVNDIAEIAISMMGLDKNKVRLEFTGGGRGWKGDIPIVRFDTEKIRNLGWSNKRDSRQAIIDSIGSMIEEIKR